MDFTHLPQRVFAFPRHARTLPRSASTILCLAALIGCSDTKDTEHPSSTERVLLAPFSELTVLDSTEDPLANHRPEVVNCNPLTGWFIESLDAENNVLEANTGDCNYLAVTEKARSFAQAGDVLVTELSYFDLTAAEPSQAHVAFTIRDDVIWETTIPIPSDADVRPLEITLTEPVAEGDPIGIHLHNHGQNSWNFSPIYVVRKVNPR